MGIPMRLAASGTPIAANVPCKVCKVEPQLEVVGKSFVVNEKEVPSLGADDVDPVQSKATMQSNSEDVPGRTVLATKTQKPNECTGSVVWSRI